VPTLVSMICKPDDVVTGFAADWVMASFGIAVETIMAIAAAVHAPHNRIGNIRIDQSPVEAPSL
jgi:hypothetical protein